MSGHVPALDGVRAVAVLEVFLFHAFASHHVYGYWALVHHGNLGVESFFVLSGFLITLRLLELAGRTDLSTGGRWRSFLIRRTARIFPLYYATLAVVFWLGPAVGVLLPAKVLPWYVGYAANVLFFWKARFIGIAPFWSLCVEEQFYLLFPALVLTKARRWLPGLTLAGALVALALRIAFATSTGRGAWVGMLPPAHFDALGAGIAAALCVHQGERALLGERGFYRIGVAAALAFLVVVVFADASPTMSATLPTLLSLATAALVLALWKGRSRGLTRVFGVRPLVLIGRVSYGVYVWHALFLAVLWRFRAPWLPPIALLRGAIALALTLTVAAVSWRFFERPIVERARRMTTPSSPSQKRKARAP